MECKQLTETALRQQTYGEVPQDPKIFMYCGISNLKLGYGIIAEQMFKRAVVYPEVVNEAKKNLAIIYQD